MPTALGFVWVGATIFTPRVNTGWLVQSQLNPDTLQIHAFPPRKPTPDKEEGEDGASATFDIGKSAGKSFNQACLAGTGALGQTHA